jgi:hypothetical protein
LLAVVGLPELALRATDTPGPWLEVASLPSALLAMRDGIVAGAGNWADVARGVISVACFSTFALAMAVAQMTRASRAEDA